jgi:hypothetical protein
MSSVHLDSFMNQSNVLSVAKFCTATALDGLSNGGSCGCNLEAFSCSIYRAATGFFVSKKCAWQPETPSDSVKAPQNSGFPYDYLRLGTIGNDKVTIGLR